MPSPSNVFENAVRLLKPGKCIIVYTPRLIFTKTFYKNIVNNLCIDK